MKKFLTTLLALSTLTTFGQQWDILGNNNATNPAIHYVGTFNNFPLNLRTNNTPRLHINEDLTNAFGVPTDGYIGIGIAPTETRSRLTITGTNNTFAPGAGFRAWMQTGVFNLENSDALYVGLKDESQNGTVFNRSDAVVVWSDDATTNGGIDKLRFIFTGPANANTNIINPLSSTSRNGYEYMQMSASPN